MRKMMHGLLILCVSCPGQVSSLPHAVYMPVFSWQYVVLVVQHERLWSLKRAGSFHGLWFLCAQTGNL